DDHPETDIVLLPKDKRQYKIGNEHIGYSYELLANRSKFSDIEPTIVYVTPKDANLRHEPYTHKQEEFIYILEGSIHLLYDGQRTYMEKGDTAYLGVQNHTCSCQLIIRGPKF